MRPGSSSSGRSARSGPFHGGHVCCSIDRARSALIDFAEEPDDLPDAGPVAHRFADAAEPSPVRLAGSLYPVATPLEDG
ncbi:MAG: hypothetical protein ACRDPD_11075, partial [Streptosporangiaceae bacterium]